MASTSLPPTTSQSDLDLLSTAALILRLSPEEKERLIEHTTALAAEESDSAAAAAVAMLGEDVSPVDSKGSVGTTTTTSSFDGGIPHEGLDDALKAFSDAYIAALLGQEEVSTELSPLSILLPQQQNENKQARQQHVSGCDTDRPSSHPTPPPPPRLPGDARLFGSSEFVGSGHSSAMDGAQTPAPAYPSFLLEDQWSPKKKVTISRCSFPSLLSENRGQSSIMTQTADTGRSSGKSNGMSFQKIQCFKTKQCRFWLDGRCTRGDDCTFAHCDGELRDKPDLTKTKICAKWRAGQCDKGASQCTYAHGVEELRQIAADAESNSGAEDWWSPTNKQNDRLQEQHW